MSADIDCARSAGRALADAAGPVDPVVVARIAALVHAAVCNTPVFATRGRPVQAAPVLTDSGEAPPDVCP
jgi:hypothetical protein